MPRHYCQCCHRLSLSQRCETSTGANLQKHHKRPHKTHRYHSNCKILALWIQASAVIARQETQQRRENSASAMYPARLNVHLRSVKVVYLGLTKYVSTKFNEYTVLNVFIGFCADAKDFSRSYWCLPYDRLLSVMKMLPFYLSVCPSVRLWRCALRLNDTSYSKSVLTSE